MNNRDKNSRYIHNRERTSNAQYSTLNTSRLTPAQMAKIRTRRIRIISISVVLIALLSIGALYVFYNWEDITESLNNLDEQVIHTPTPLPTSIPAPTVRATPTPTPEPDITPAPVVTATPKPPVVEFTISVAGDLTFYQTQLMDAYDSSTGTYDFSHNFEAIKPYFDESDFVIANFNSVCLGDRISYSGDPATLNTPETIMDDLKEAGVDCLMTANENFFSQGWIGAQYTKNFIQKAGLVSTGVYLSEAEYYKPLMTEVEGVKIALLNYANKRAVDEIEQNISESQAGYGIKVLKMSNVNRDVDICRSAGADLIFAYVNWGEKTYLAPTGDIQSYAAAMTEAGVDCIFGAYPEVLQPIVPKGIKRGKDEPTTGVIAYSLGSLITSRRTQYLDSSAILNITYVYDTINDILSMGEITYVPTWVSVRNDGGADYDYRVIPVGKYLDDMDLYSTLTEVGQERLPNVWSEIVSILGEGSVAPVRD